LQGLKAGVYFLRIGSDVQSFILNIGSIELGCIA
jgi:hypothetical protein